MFLPSCCTLIWYQDDDDDDNPPLASLPKSHIHRVHEGSWLFGVFEMQGRTGVWIRKRPGIEEKRVKGRRKEMSEARAATSSHEMDFAFHLTCPLLLLFSLSLSLSIMFRRPKPPWMFLSSSDWNAGKRRCCRISWRDRHVRGRTRTSTRARPMNSQQPKCAVPSAHGPPWPSRKWPRHT